MPTIGRLLVANRSEIAVRVFRACKELGITSIAIYSEIDRDAFHLGFADEAYYVGETPPAESYLNTGHIIEAARKGRADAVVAASRAGVEGWLRGMPGCTVLRGHAAFESSTEVRVGDDARLGEQ